MKQNFLQLLLAGFMVISTSFIYGQQPITYYLPDIVYSDGITTPQEFLGHQIGEWHISHDQIVAYAKLVASQSDRVEYYEIGRTHENRPLINLHISTPNNLKNKEEIRKQHLKLTDVNSSSNVNVSEMPIVLYQGHSIHGNEPSGVNASALVMYYLAAGQGEEVLKVLEHSYIIFDPCYNPDGVQRFSTWANSHKGYNLITDPQSREYNEVWPKGRTNHYWFDLNRDWLLLTHPESQARIKVFHQWKPNILTDHHEMSTNSTFFFQPGIPSRTNPNTPWKNQELTEKIGEFHAAALDEIGSQYFTKAQYDDFYYGKGSTYPDIHGGIGILFEQASSRGHLQESDNGLLSFPFTIRNQVVTSLSTQRAALNLRIEILEYQKEFYKLKMADAQKDIIKAYRYTDQDIGKLTRFTEILLQHDIEIFKDMKNSKVEMIVPCNQKQYGLIKTIFEKVTEYQDSIFYDVSAWTLPLAFDLEYNELSKNALNGLKLEQIYDVNELRNGRLIETEKPYSWVFEWVDHDAPKVLNGLFKEGIHAKVVTMPITIAMNGESKVFGSGSIIIPAANQLKSISELKSVLRNLATTHKINIYELSTGYTSSGMTTGNPQNVSIYEPKMFTLVGDGVSSYDVGEVWHYVDHHLNTTITMIDSRDLSSSNLSRYNTLILADGRYRNMTESDDQKLKEWIEKGGKVIAMQGALNYLKKQKLINIEAVERQKSDVIHAMRQYQGSGKDRGAAILGGAIFSANIDLTHPLAYGYSDEEIPMFRVGTSFYQSTKNALASPLKYNTSVLHSGYVPKGVVEMAKNAPASSIHKFGKGSIICFSDNLLFRGYWWGTHRMFANAIYFADLIDNNSKEN